MVLFACLCLRTKWVQNNELRLWCMDEVGIYACLITKGIDEDGHYESFVIAEPHHMHSIILSGCISVYLMSVCYGNLVPDLISLYHSSNIKIRFKLINESFMIQVGQMQNSIGFFL